MSIPTAVNVTDFVSPRLARNYLAAIQRHMDEYGEALKAEESGQWLDGIANATDEEVRALDPSTVRGIAETLKCFIQAHRLKQQLDLTEIS